MFIQRAYLFTTYQSNGTFSKILEENSVVVHIKGRTTATLK